MSKPVFTTKSSTIHKVDYNEAEKTLEIEFRSGNVYRYYSVPPRMYKVFQLYIECEGSAGSFFNEYIKNQFTSERVKTGSGGEEE
ncbi:MAG: KTSC domain-containing protein [Sphingobacteriales bacterium]|nr:MAG: KTSC domain-containing protein [Sphingobacteriales bacterium]